MLKLPRVKKPALKAKKATKKSLDERRSFRLSRKKETPYVPPVITMRRLLKETFVFFKQNWKLLTILSLLYAAAYRLLVEGLFRFDLAAFQDKLVENDVNGLGDAAALTSGAFSATSGDAGAQSGTFAAILTIVFALAVVWAVRRRLAGHDINVRDALYNSAAPIIPVLVVLAIIFVQLLPMAISLFLFIAASSAGIAVSGVENLALFLVTLTATILSCYWVTSSIIGLVAVTVPGMYPIAALRGAKELVAYRRGSIFARLVLFGILMTIGWFLVIILTVTNGITLFLANEIISILRGFTMVFAVIYIYKLYRSLVDETAQ